MESNLCIESPGENGGFAGMKVCHGLGSMQVYLYLAYFCTHKYKSGIDMVE